MSSFIAGLINKGVHATYRPMSLHLLSDSEDDEKALSHSVRTYFRAMLSILKAMLPILWNTILALVPSFITNLFKAGHEPRKLHPTSFLDGLRGYASFVVAYVHLVAPYERWLLPSYGHSTDAMGSNVLQLPLIRVAFAARPMIHIFMVISGYVLSSKAIRQARKDKYDEMNEVVTSMVFRRGIRLFLPSIAGIVLLEASVWCGWQYWQPDPTIWGKLHGIYVRVSQLVWAWDWDHEYDKQLLQLWTIPVEFACSMMLFVVLLGTSRLKSRLRMGVVAALAFHCQASGHWGPFEFLVGMLICEVETIVDEKRQDAASNLTPAAVPSDSGASMDTKGERWPSARFRKAFWITIFLIGVFLAGYPEEDAGSTWGFRTLTALTPQVYINAGAPLPSFFCFSIAASLIIASMFRVSALRRPFETSFAQYIGDISYSVYIVHYPTVMSLERRIVDQSRWMVGGTDTQTKRIGAVLLETIILMLIVVWQADLFWRFVDRPVVAFARRAEKYCRRANV